MILRIRILCLALLAAGCGSGAARFKVEADFSKAPGAAVYAEKSKLLCEEWYPKINQILFGDGHPLYLGMVIHELTHVNQNYKAGSENAEWVSEGIADYIRHKYFEGDIQPKLRLDSSGLLTGYSLREPFSLDWKTTKSGSIKAAIGRAIRWRPRFCSGGNCEKTRTLCVS